MTDDELSNLAANVRDLALLAEWRAAVWAARDVPVGAGWQAHRDAGERLDAARKALLGERPVVKP